GGFEQNRFRVFLQFLAGASRNRRTRRKNFDAAALATWAQRTVGIDAHVAALRSRSGPSMINVAVENDSGSDAGSDGGVKYVVVSASRSPLGFRERGGISVVVDFHCSAWIDAAERVAQGKIVPARQIWRIDDHAGNWIQRTRSANADCARRI